MGVNQLQDNERFICGRLHYRTQGGTWREYTNEEMEQRLHQLSDNPAGSFRDDDK